MAVRQLLSAATASAAPTLTDETLGKPINDLGPCDQCLVTLKSTAGSGTMTALVEMWGFHTELDRWFNLGGLNGNAAIEETTAEAINYAEMLVGLRRFSRLYCEIVTLGGTATAIDVHIDPIRATSGSR